MKVNLIKHAEYDLNEAKFNKMGFETFCNLTGVSTFEDTTVTENPYDDVRLFTSIDEFRNSDIKEFDETKDVFVMSNGNFCVFLKNKSITEQPKNNESTDTKKS